MTARRCTWLGGCIVLCADLFSPGAAYAGFRETRNATGVLVYHLSREQNNFYRRELFSQAWYEGAPVWGYGLRVRTYSSRDVGLDLSVMYCQQKGDVALVSHVLLQVGPLFPLPFAGESRAFVPYGSAGVTLLRTAFDADSQIDLGFHLKVGVEVPVFRFLGACLEGMYTLVSVTKEQDQGLDDYLIKSRSFGDFGWSIGINYYP
jgi:hypothetical protein